MDNALESQIATKRHIRSSIIVIAIIAFLSLFTVSISSISWRASTKDVYLAVLYPVFFISIILVIAKIRIGYFVALLVSINYAVLMVPDVGEYFIFRNNNSILLVVLVLPFFLVISLIPLSISYLLSPNKQKKKVLLLSIAVAVCFPLYAIIDRANANYTKRIYTECTVTSDKVIITCKPSFADARQFLVESDSRELADLVKSGSDHHTTTIIEENYNFGTFRSITFIKVGDKTLQRPLTWESAEIRGDISFLRP